MSTKHVDVDRITKAWLAEGPTELANRVLDAALDEVHLTRQRRGFSVPWRTLPVNRLVAAAAAVLIVAVVGGGYLALRDQGVGGPAATASPSPLASPSTPAGESAAPAATPVAVDRSAEGGYTLSAPAEWNLRVISSGLHFSPPAPIVSVYVGEGAPEPGSNPPEYTIEVGVGLPGTHLLRGTTLDELVDSTKAFHRAIGGTQGPAHPDETVDAEPARVLEVTGTAPDLVWFDVIAIHGEHALFVAVSAPPDGRDVARAALDELIASIRWTD